MTRARLEDGDEVGRVIVSEADLQARIAELGAAITADYQGRPPLLVGVLKGAFMFMSDLSRAIALPCEVDFMAVSSYGSATRTSGVVRIVKDLDLDLLDRHVLVVEDIVDSGLTLSYLQRYLLARQPASLEVCALLVKEGQQRTALDLRYVGLHHPGRLRDRLRARRGRAVPEPPGHPRLRRPDGLNRRCHPARWSDGTARRSDQVERVAGPRPGDGRRVER